MLSKFSVRKPYTVVVAIVLIIILGVVSFTKMTVDLLPNMNMPYALVITSYPGASPEEVELTVTKPVEQAMATISNISSISSSSMENASTVILEFEQTANMDSATIEMRESLDQIQGYWPDTVGNPIIMKLNPTMLPIMISGISVEGKEAAEASRIIEEEVLPEIESLEGVASVTVSGDIEETLRITIKEEKVSSVDASVQNQLDKKFKEAEDALSDAKAEVENGKAQMEAAASQAGSQLTEAEKQLSEKDLQISQGLMEINSKRQELELVKVALEQATAVLDASEQSLLEQKQELDALKSNEGSLRSQYDTVNAQIQELLASGQEVSAELLLAQTTLAGQIAILDQYDTSMQIIQEGLAQVTESRNELAAQSAEIQAGEELLNQTQKQLESGALTLAAARAQMSSAQLTAALQMSSASAQLAVGESTIQQSEEELKAAKEAAKASANISAMLNATMIQTILTAQNFNMPAGYVTENGIDYLIRVGDKFHSIEELKELVLVEMEGIDPIKLSDIADVERVDNSDSVYAKLNGENGILLTIQKQTGYSTGEVSDRILERLEELEKEVEGLHTVALMDQGIYIDLVVDSVLENLLFGAILAIAILLVFLKDIRPTFVIACSIPISIMTAIVLMYFSGVTLNVISLSGLALGVGMLVDNSIVVIENIYRMRNEEGATAKKAAIEGAKQVAGAITASTLTTVCVFLPIVFTEGIARQLFVDMALTIGYSLLASLIVALTVVPMMSAGILRKTEQKEGKFYIKIKNGYAKLLQWALHKKALVLIGSLVLFVLTGIWEVSRGTEFMPAMESTEISMTILAEEGAEFADITKDADAFIAEIEKLDDITDIGAMIGTGSLLGSGSDSSQVSIYALLNDERTMSDMELKSALEEIAKEQGITLSVSMSNMDMSALGGSGLTVRITGRELDTLQTIAKDVAAIVEADEGTVEVSDGMEETTEELRVIVDKEKAIAHGLTVAQVYQSVAAELASETTATTLDMDAVSLDVVVAEQKAKEMSREEIQNMTLEISKDDGSIEIIPLKDIAEFEAGEGLQAISRSEQNRYIDVTAGIADDDNVGLVSNRIERELGNYDLPEGYSLEMQGEDQTINETMIELLKMLGLAIVFMYLIMVAQFQSLRSPFIVMFTVPLAFTGGFIGLLVSGGLLSVIAMVGFIMLSGIIVNNGIVFIDYANQLVEEGFSVEDALVETGRTRLRPIIMTALTTVLGLSTMALGYGQGADLVQPMAVVTIGGLLYGTLLTLFVVPCIYGMFNKKEKARLKDGIDEEDEID